MVIATVFVAVVVMVVMVAMVVAVVSTAHENVHVNACRQSDAVIAFFFNMEANERNAFFVLIFAHVHHGVELGFVERTVFVGVKHGEHHFHEFIHVVVVVIVVGSFVAVVVMLLMVMLFMVVFISSHGAHHFSELIE